MKRILVVDDDKVQHILFRKKAERISKDFEVLFFDAAEECLTYLKDHTADILFSDVNLGDMDGWELIGELAKIDFKGKVFLLTGSVAPSDRRKAKSEGLISGFFEKPISDSDLREILEA